MNVNLLLLIQEDYDEGDDLGILDCKHREMVATEEHMSNLHKKSLGN